MKNNILTILNRISIIESLYFQIYKVVKVIMIMKNNDFKLGIF